jgi:hypothetical protein
MKTHEIAKVLSALAQGLRDAPDQSLDEFTSRTANPKPNPASIPTALSTLVALADFDKRQWQAFISEYEMPIQVRPRDASRDILGKVLKHLEQNPQARQRLRNAVTHRPRTDISPELMSALQLLLK